MDVKKAILGDLDKVKRSLLLLLSSDNYRPINGKLWYQKELFMLAKNDKELELEANFEPYFWGPFSELAENEMEEMLQLGIVQKEGQRYVLTGLGKDIAQEISKGTNKEEIELIKEIKDFLNDLSKEELLLFIYLSNPEMSEESVELKNLIKKRKEVAVRLYKKGKVSIGKAAEIAGESVAQLIKELQSKKIYVVEE